MNLKEQRLILAASYLIFLMLIFYPSLNTLVSSTESEFTGLSILNIEGKTGNYFNSSTSEVSLGEKNDLLFGIDNHNKGPIYVRLIIRITHEEGSLPNNQLQTPSQEPQTYQITKMLAKYESIQIPFSFTLTQGTDDGIFKLKLQENQATSEILLDESRIGKIIVELWKYNEDTAQFEFAQIKREAKICIWTQLYFYVKET